MCWYAVAHAYIFFLFFYFIFFFFWGTLFLRKLYLKTSIFKTRTYIYMPILYALSYPINNIFSQYRNGILYISE